MKTEAIKTKAGMTVTMMSQAEATRAAGQIIIFDFMGDYIERLYRPGDTPIHQA